MSDAAAPPPGHELLLGLAGWVDDDLLAIGRELVAVGEEAGALELLVATLAADRTALPHPLRSGMADAVERRVGGGLAGLLPPGAPLPDRTAHAFAPDGGDPAAAARINEVVAGLTSVARSGARTSVTWRLTPAGAAPGPLPHPVVLLVLDDPGPAEVLAYQVGAALARAGVTASVEAFVDGAALPPYQRAALAAAGEPVRPDRRSAGQERTGVAPTVTAGDLPSVATPTSATVTGPYEPDPLNDPLETTSGSAAAGPGALDTRGAVPEDPSWSGPYAAAPTVGAPRSDDPGRSTEGDRRDGSAADPGRSEPPRADATVPADGVASAGPGTDRPEGDRTRPAAPSVEDTHWTPPTGAAGAGLSAEAGGSSSPVGDDGSSTTDGTRSTSPVASPGEHTGSASSAEGSEAARIDRSTGPAALLDDGRYASPLDDAGTGSPVHGTGPSSQAESPGPASPVRSVGAAPSVGNTGGASPARSAEGASPVDDTGSPSPARRTGADSPAQHTGSASPDQDTGPASSVGDTGAASSVSGTGTAAPERTATGAAPESSDAGPATAAGATSVPPQPTVGAAGVDPARFDPARNAVDRTVHGGSAVTGRPPGPPANGSTAPGSATPTPSADVPAGPVTGDATPARPEPAPDPDPSAGGNGHPSPRPAPRRIPRPAPPDPGRGDQPVDGRPPPGRSAGSEQEWARQWSTGTWSTPTGSAPERDPDVEPATSPTPTTPPFGRVPPSPTRRSGEAAEAFDADPDGSRGTLSPEPRRRHRLDDVAERAVAEEEHAPPDVLDSRLTPNEQELLRRLQQELAAREGGSADQPSSQRNGTPHPPERG